MATHDLTHTILGRSALDPAVALDDDAVGATIDTQDFSSLAFLIAVANASVAADAAVSLEESVDGATWTPVAAADQYDETVEIGNSAPDALFQLGYRGVQRYVRAAVTVAAGTLDIAIAAVLGHPGESPTY